MDTSPIDTVDGSEIPKYKNPVDHGIFTISAGTCTRFLPSTAGYKSIPLPVFTTAFEKKTSKLLILLGQWLNFKLFGITCLVGKIKFKLFQTFISGFHWLSELW